MQVGDVVKLTLPLLGNNRGTIGICYETYVLGDHIGASFIFENGNYDGFSPEEQKEMLEYLGNENNISDYRFTNVMKLSQDFETDYFKFTFDKWNKKEDNKVC